MKEKFLLVAALVIIFGFGYAKTEDFFELVTTEMEELKAVEEKLRILDDFTTEEPENHETTSDFPPSELPLEIMTTPLLLSDETSKFTPPADNPKDIHETTLAFLETVKSTCYFLQHLHQIFRDDENFSRMKHFENAQNLVFTSSNDSRLNAAKETLESLQDEIDSLWILLENKSDATTIRIGQYFGENFSKNRASALDNLIYETEFMKTMEKIVAGIRWEKSTPNRVFYDFYASAVYWLVKQHAVYMMAAERIDKNMHTDFFTKMVNANFKHHYLKTKYNPKIFAKFLDSISARTQINLKTTNAIGFNTFLQRIVQAEKNIKGGSCSITCVEIEKLKFERNGCYGELRGCEKMEIKGSEIEVYFSKNKTKIHDENSKKRGTILHQYNTVLGFLGFNCDVCKCICDQKKHNETERFLYAGKVEAEDGFVVTGVRFAKENSVIFVQIQTGKLTSGYIDQNSVAWSSIPKDLTTNVHILNYDKRGFYLEELKLSGAVLKGIQIVARSNSSFALRITGHPILKNGEKSLEKVLPNYGEIQKGKIGEEIALKFVPKSLDDGMGQETVPRFDGGDVTLDPAVPVAGIGLVYYASGNKADGVIKPYLISANPVIFVQKLE